MAAKDYGAVIDAEQGGKWWEKKQVSKEERMAMNGETEAQMAYCEAVSRNREGGVSLNPEDGNDTSVDQEWHIPKDNVFTISWEEHNQESLLDRMEKLGLIMTREKASDGQKIVVKSLLPGVVLHRGDGREIVTRKLSTTYSKDDKVLTRCVAGQESTESWPRVLEKHFPVTVAKEDYSGADRYVLATTVGWMLPKLIVFFPVMWLLSCIPMLIARFYISALPEPFDRVPRTGGFYFWFCLTFILSIPAILVIIVNLVLDSIMYYFFSLIFCTFTWNWATAMKGIEKIRPFRGGPSIIMKMPDIFICVMGQSMRQGVLETIYMVSMMWVLMPWLKYYINANPWIYELDYRLVQQISTGMPELGTVDEVAEECRRVISRARHSRERAKRIDLWSFVPHYPYPPADRRWALGMQAGGGAYPGKFTLLVHPTHADSKMGCSCLNTRGVERYCSRTCEEPPCPHSGSQEQFVLSNSIARPVYRVMLWYSNPFHFLTGFVEASISTGLPSQPDKMHGGEHPMWLISAKTHLTASRESFTGSGLIDWFFDYWLPVFVHEVRYAMNYRDNLFLKKMSSTDSHTDALKKADAKYQEVSSSDGISAMKSKIGLDQYHHSTLEDYRKQGEADNKERFQSFDSNFAKLNETNVGLSCQSCCLGKDLHEANDDIEVESETKEQKKAN